MALAATCIWSISALVWVCDHFCPCNCSHTVFDQFLRSFLWVCVCVCVCSFLPLFDNFLDEPYQQPWLAEGVRDWSDHLRKALTRQLLVWPKFWIHKTLTANGKIFGLTKVRVVGSLPPALAAVWHVWSFLPLFDHLLTNLISSSLARRNSHYPYSQLTRCGTTVWQLGLAWLYQSLK